jgi:hypothetical protein
LAEIISSIEVEVHSLQGIEKYLHISFTSIPSSEIHNLAMMAAGKRYGVEEMHEGLPGGIFGVHAHAHADEPA